MRVLLVSTYELGHQPIHVASPAARLRYLGYEVSTLDLAVEAFDDRLVADADAVAFSVPMHTAMRLALASAERIRESNATTPIAFYGLYARVGREHSLDGLADVLLEGEYESGLVDWLEGLDKGAGIQTGNSRSGFHVPDRSTLPTNHQYARLEWNGTAVPAAAVEASHGCRHRCRHCPLPIVYDGRLRVVGAEVVLEDIDQLAAAGVAHVTFADPDFLNAPRYSTDILREAHAAHPDLTFDVTVKVEHVLKHRDMWPELKDLGVLFVVSAFESVDEETLLILDKSHTVPDMAESLEVLRRAGIHTRPTWLPFFPWTTPSDVADLVEFLDEHRLWTSTDPVQLGIKLLIPEGSLLESHPAVVPFLTSYDPASLTWRWSFQDPESELLQKELEAISAEASDCGEEVMETFTSMRSVISARVPDRDWGRIIDPGPITPRLSESWFCCAEPTFNQGSSIGVMIGRVD